MRACRNGRRNSHLLLGRHRDSRHICRRRNRIQGSRDRRRRFCRKRSNRYHSAGGSHRNRSRCIQRHTSQVCEIRRRRLSRPAAQNRRPRILRHSHHRTHILDSDQRTWCRRIRKQQNRRCHTARMDHICRRNVFRRQCDHFQSIHTRLGQDNSIGSFCGMPRHQRSKSRKHGSSRHFRRCV